MKTDRWKQLISTFNNSNVNLAKKNFGKFGVSHKLTYVSGSQYKSVGITTNPL